MATKIKEKPSYIQGLTLGGGVGVGVGGLGGLGVEEGLSWGVS